MLITEFGVGTTLLIGAALGIFGFIILSFWLEVFGKPFCDEKRLWAVFWIHQIVCMVGTCIFPYDWLNESKALLWALMIYFFGSLAVMAVVKIFGARE